MGLRVGISAFSPGATLIMDDRYRNFLMVCTALMEQHQQSMYFAQLDFPIPPGVKNLQRWIEAAWKSGRNFVLLWLFIRLPRSDRI
jgi:hypothetical protein